MLITRIILYGIGALALAGLVTLGLSYKDPDSQLFSVSSGLLLAGNAVIVIMLQQFGHLKKTKYMMYMWGAIAVFFTGAVLQLTKTESGTHVFNFGLMAVPAVYLMSYLSKEHKRTDDHLKLIWITSYFALAFLHANHYITSILPDFIAQLILWYLFIRLAVDIIRKEKQVMLEDYLAEEKKKTVAE